VISALNELLGVHDSIDEVRRRHIEPSHALMQTFERTRVVDRRDRLSGHGSVVRPKRHCEAVSLVDPWPHSRLKSANWAPGIGEALSKVDFELRNLLLYTTDSGKDVARQQTQRELVRVVKNDRVIYR
jgi:hypothetical protein